MQPFEVANDHPSANYGAEAVAHMFCFPARFAVWSDCIVEA